MRRRSKKNIMLLRARKQGKKEKGKGVEVGGRNWDSVPLVDDGHAVEGNMQGSSG